MERNSPGALHAPGAFGASDTSDPHASLYICSLYITHVCSLAAVLRPSAAAPLTTAAAPAPPAPRQLFSACESVAVLWQAMRVCSLAPLAARPPSPAAPAPPAPLSASFGRTAVLPNPASLAGDDAAAARYTPHGRALYPPTDAGFE